MGGTEGVGLAFLEESFGSSTAPPEHRLHQRAVRHVLGAVLPEGDTTIRSQPCSEAMLLEASGYGNCRDDFDDLMRILDSETRLLTPVDPEAAGAHAASTHGVESDQRYYQLTHDYLVPAVRELAEAETERDVARPSSASTDRADGNLAGQAAAPPAASWWEFINIRCAVPNAAGPACNGR